jgi:A/G-specific adenine glycosylase
MPRFTFAEAAAVRASLLGWFRRHARRLPWRQAKSPYKIWLSEIMLQQTQIATVIPFYRRFLAEFPTIERLAAAPLERVLERWSGLGYYHRARRLHLAAWAIVGKHGGRFPRDFETARRLPGVGDYTARAVASIAYGQPYAVLDGNVARVMARLLALRGSLPQPEFRRAVERNLASLLSLRSPGNFNQALMELGQTICLPRSPQCTSCPLRHWCRAWRMGKPESFPAPRPRRKPQKWHMAAAALLRNDRVLMVRGLDNGLVRDLWNFPSALGESSSMALARLRKKLRAAVGTSVSLKRLPHRLHHNITYRSIEVQVYKGELSGKPQGSGFGWFPIAAIERAAVSQLARKIARKLAQGGLDAPGGPL